jgi:hypothetical protein
MKAIEEYNEVETMFHGINEWAFNRLLQEASGIVENIVLFGRVFNPDLPLLEAESEQDYEEVQGAGYVYACDFYNRENATPGASAQAGVTLILGWDGIHDVDAINKRGGEYLVPLASYKVIGVVE